MEFQKNYGNYIKLEFRKKIYEGILLPSPEKGFVLLKLKNGYNLGFKKKDIANFETLKEIKKEKEKFEIPHDVKKPKVAMVILGGTIAARLNPGRGGVDFVETPEDLFNYYPKIFEKANFEKIKIPFMKGSENMDYKDWQKVAKVVCNLVNDKEVSGIIVTQGTDSLHYTSSALSFFLKNLGKPVVITFSQRSIDRGSSDAQLNLICATQIAISHLAGIFVLGHANSNDDFCYALLGAKVRKMHSSKRDAFKPINKTAIAKVYENRIEMITEHDERDLTKKCILDSKFEEKVAILKFYPGQNPNILDYYLRNGYKGLILEMTGLGHVATTGARLSWIKKLKEVQKKGLIICGVPQTIYGRLNPMVYVTGRELKETGIIYLEDMLSETAFVKLGWVLGHKEWSLSKEIVQQKMLENISGEIDKRILYEPEIR